MFQRRNASHFMRHSEICVILKLSLLSWAYLERIGWQCVN